MSHSEKKLIS